MDYGNLICPLISDAGCDSVLCWGEECGLFCYETDTCALLAIAETLSSMDEKAPDSRGLETGPTCPLKGGKACDGRACAFAVAQAPREAREVREVAGGYELRTVTTRRWTCTATHEAVTVDGMSTEARQPYDGDVSKLPRRADPLPEPPAFVPAPVFVG